MSNYSDDGEGVALIAILLFLILLALIGWFWPFIWLLVGLFALGVIGALFETLTESLSNFIKKHEMFFSFLRRFTNAVIKGLLASVIPLALATGLNQQNMSVVILMMVITGMVVFIYSYRANSGSPTLMDRLNNRNDKSPSADRITRRIEPYIGNRIDKDG